MPEASVTRNINIPFSTLFKVVLLVVGLYFAYQILDVLALVFVAIIFSTALDPSVDWLQRWHLPRSLAVLLIYVLLFASISLILTLMAPPLVDQLGELANRLPSYYNQLLASVSRLQGVAGDQAAATLQQALQSLGASLAQATTSLISTVVGVFGGLLQFIIVLVITFYLIVQENGLKRFVHSLTPVQHQAYVGELLHRIQEKLGRWLRGELLLMLVVGVMTYVALQLVGMDYALVLGLWAGITELIPYLGPILGAIPAVLLALTISPLQAVLTLLAYVVVQQLEGHIIVPLVMRRAVGLNPIVSIVVIMIGVKLDGVVGAIMSIPVATAAAVVLSDYMEARRRGAGGVGLTEPGEAGPVS